MTASTTVYGSVVAGRDIASSSRSSSPGASTVRFDVLQEALRQQLAHAPLGAGAAARARLSRRCAPGSARSPRPARQALRPWSPRSSRSAGATRRRRTICSDSSASIDATVRSAPSRSALLTTKMSAISMIPALSACTSSPAPGTTVDDRDVGGADDVHFVLADADGLDEDDVLARGVEDERDFAGGRAPGRRDGRASPCCG